MQLFLFLVFIIALAFVVLTFQNPAAEITLKFINWTYAGPLAVVLTIPFAAGILAGLSLLLPTWWRKSKAVRAQKRRVHELEKELDESRQQIEEAQQAEPEVKDEEAGDRHISSGGETF